ncbi:hypothetical protein EAE99_009083 [Botrytis elliptica]|nr:hypothetical protein EAE99_009083 [Botrytis elliptica]
MDTEITKKQESAVAKMPAEGEEETMVQGLFNIRAKFPMILITTEISTSPPGIIAGKESKNYEALNLERHMISLMKWVTELLPIREEKAKLYTEFVKDANDLVWTFKDHPNRNENYLQVVDVGESLNDNEHKSQEMLDWKYLDWFRKLANVSRQFRLELGSTIWERSKIYCRGDKKVLVLGQFLEASPGITKGIRELVVSVSQLVEHWDDTCVENEWDYIMNKGLHGTQATFFQNFMEVVSQNLNLDFFTLSIGGPKSCIVDLAAGEGVMKVLTETRALKVTKGFRAEISSIHPENNDGKENARKLAEFRIEWEPKITAALLPDVLRPQTPKTDRNHYLASRAKEQEIGAID